MAKRARTPWDGHATKNDVTADRLMNLELEALSACARLDALAFMLQQCSGGPNQMDEDTITVVGSMIAEHALDAKKAAEGLAELCRTQAGAAHG